MTRFSTIFVEGATAGLLGTPCGVDREHPMIGAPTLCRIESKIHILYRKAPDATPGQIYDAVERRGIQIDGRGDEK